MLSSFFAWPLINKFIRNIITFVNKARSVLLFGCFSVYEDNVEDNKKS